MERNQISNTDLQIKFANQIISGQMLINAVSYLTDFVTSKSKIESFSNQIISEVKNGNQNPLTIKIFCRAILKAIGDIEKNIGEEVLTEAEKYGERKFSLYGCDVELAELGIKYDFSKCNDSEWDNLEAEIQRLTEKKKEREQFLKNIKKPIACSDTGEIINPPIKRSTSGVKITFK